MKMKLCEVSGVMIPDEPARVKALEEILRLARRFTIAGSDRARERAAMQLQKAVIAYDIECLKARDEEE